MYITYARNKDDQDINVAGIYRSESEAIKRCEYVMKHFNHMDVEWKVDFIPADIPVDFDSVLVLKEEEK